MFQAIMQLTIYLNFSKGVHTSDLFLIYKVHILLLIQTKKKLYNISLNVMTYEILEKHDKLFSLVYNASKFLYAYLMDS